MTDQTPDLTTDDQPAPRRSTGRRILKVGAYAVGATVILSIGVAAGGGPPERVETVKEVEVEVEVPGKTVTKEVEVEVEVPGPERTVEVEVPGDDVEVVPPVCIDALDDAETVVHFVADMLATGAFTAADNAALGDMVDDYNSTSLGCRILAEATP